MKYALIDVETTGLDPKTNAIWQIAMILVDGPILGAPIVREFRPYKDSVLDPKALEVCGISKNYLDRLPLTSVDVAWEFVSIIKKFRGAMGERVHFVAYNSSFDYQFVREWYNRHHIHAFAGQFYWPSIDVAGMASLKVDPKTRPRRFRLQEACGCFDIAFDTKAAHDAQYDIEKTYELFKKVMPK
ncbi:MAG: hypothetical protein COA65_09930 [Rhodospirillaceae bacterium]|nr:MAG: hypothetical protein COA65_09930 [Rhodospirillaceae bacterium]